MLAVVCSISLECEHNVLCSSEGLETKHCARLRWVTAAFFFPQPLSEAKNVRGLLYFFTRLHHHGHYTSP